MKTLVFVLCCLMVQLASAKLPVYLESEDGIGNGMKECTYSDGSVITIKADDLCPPSKDADAEE